MTLEHILVAVLREQAHIDRRALVTVIPQALYAAEHGKRPPTRRTK